MIITKSDLYKLEEEYILLNEELKKIEARNTYNKTSRIEKKELDIKKLKEKIIKLTDLYTKYVFNCLGKNQVKLNDYVNLKITNNNGASYKGTYRLVSKIENPNLDIDIYSEFGQAIFGKNVRDTVTCENGLTIKITEIAPTLLKIKNLFINLNEDRIPSIIVTHGDYVNIKNKINFLNNEILWPLVIKMQSASDDEFEVLNNKRLSILNKRANLEEKIKQYKNGFISKKSVKLNNFVILLIKSETEYKEKTYRLVNNVCDSELDIDINSKIGQMIFGKQLNDVIDLGKGVKIEIRFIGNELYQCENFYSYTENETETLVK